MMGEEAYKVRLALVMEVVVIVTPIGEEGGIKTEAANIGRTHTPNMISVNKSSMGDVRH